MPVIILLTNWNPPQGYDGYWYRSFVAPYSKDFCGHIKNLVGLKNLPAIGAYTKGKKRDYTSLPPCFLEIEEIWFDSRDSKYPYKARVVFRNNLMNVSSHEFLSALRELQLPVKSTDYVIVLDDENWDEIREKLGLDPPDWWEKLRKSSPSIFQADLLSRKYPSNLVYKAEDGHYVKSRAELIIDDWLYRHGIRHAYEHRLPTEEEIFCDFYLPDYDIYIEYWGGEGDPDYDKRKAYKKEIYRKYGFRLIEIHADEILQIDDALKRKLAKFNVNL